MTNWEIVEHDGWRLIATKEQHDWCGIWQTFGCLNHEQHFQLGKGRRVYIKQYQRSCYRPSCKECYPKWIARQANVGTQRIEKFKEQSKRQPIHLLLSVNQAQYHLPHKELKKKLKQILDVMDFSGGAVVFHPFRFNKISRQYYYAPHFHIVGFGWRSLISKGWGKFGWFVKDLGIRESVFQTFCYLLSHCGIKKGVHPVVPPDKNFEGLVDDDGSYNIVTKIHTKWISGFYEILVSYNEKEQGKIRFYVTDKELPRGQYPAILSQPEKISMVSQYLDGTITKENFVSYLQSIGWSESKIDNFIVNNEQAYVNPYTFYILASLIPLMYILVSVLSKKKTMQHA